MSRTKEEILEMLKAAVIDICNGKLTDAYDELIDEFSKTDSCDADWINTEYGKWFNSNSEIQKALNSNEERIPQLFSKP